MSLTVFISYSHDSPEHVDAMLELSDRLRVNGIDCGIDQYEQSPPGGWAQWSMRQLEKADFVLVVCSEKYHQRYTGEAPEGEGQGVKWEGAIITQQLYGAESQTGKFVPVVRQESDREFVPTPLKGLQTFMPFDDEGFEDLVRLLTGQPRVEKPELGTTPPLPPRMRTPEFPIQTGSRGGPGIDGAGQGGDGRGPSAGDDGSHGRLKPLFLLLGALLVVVLAVVGWRLLDISDDDPETGVVTQSGPKYFKNRPKYFKKLPSALLHTIRSKDFLYWLLLEVDNPTNEPVHIVVTCQVVSTPKPAKCHEEPTQFTVQPGESVIRSINPRLQWIFDDAFNKPLLLSIQWRVMDNKSNVLFTEPHDIEVGPKFRFYWELENSEGELIDKEFLIASLSAWTKTSRQSPVFLEGKALADAAPSMTEFVRAVYSAILTNEDRLSVDPGVPDLPPEIFEDFDTPKTVLASGTANPVEAVLLIGALSQSALQRFQSRLVGVSSSPDADGRRPVLAIWSDSGHAWQAIDLTRTQSGFEENLAASQNVLDEWFDSAEVMEQLESTGVYFDLDERRTAIEFARAAAIHKIQGLP